MSWLVPSALVVAGVAGLITVALHFIARSRPIAEPLPTTRFIPDRAIHARTRSYALTDVLLLLLRLLAIAALGAAVAGPVFAAGGRVARIIIADRSRAVADAGAVRDTVRAYVRTGDQLIVFDSAASAAQTSSGVDSLVATRARGSLSAALAAAMQAAVRLAERADSVELILVSPLTEEELDAATARIRAAWPGRIRVVPVRAAVVEGSAQRLDVRANANDAVAAGLSLAPMVSAPVRVTRTRPTSEDSLWARASGHVLVHWPASVEDADWPARASIDAIGGVMAGDATLVGRFPRPWVLDGPAIARWADGEAAAVERPIGDGCIRDVGILVDEASDLTLRAPFRRFAAELLVPCGGRRAAASLSAGQIGVLAGRGGLASSSQLRDRATELSRWSPWLLVLAALLLIAELAARRATKSAA